MTDAGKNNFWIAVGIGFILTVIIDVYIPVLGPLVGGFAAGFIAGGDPFNAGRAGLFAGLLAAIVVTALVLFEVSTELGGVGFLAGFFTGLFLFVGIFLYLGVLAFIGGAIAGALRK